MFIYGQSFFSVVSYYYLSHYFVCMKIVTANQVAHVNCGNCEMLLRYQYGARSVKCAICSFVTSVGVSTISSLHTTKISANMTPKLI